MNHRPIRVGITSIGSGIGQSIVQSCRLSRLPLHTIGFGANPMAFGAFDCDEHDSVPRITSPDYADILLDKCKKYRVQILIPGLDYDLPVLDLNRERFLDQGIEVLISSKAIIQLCRDKIWMSKELRKITPAFIQSFNPSSMPDAIHKGEVNFPLIAKPRNGFASRGLQVIRNEKELIGISEDHAIQPLIFPDPEDDHYGDFLEAIDRGNVLQVAEISIQLVVSKNGQLMGRMASYNKLNNGVPIEIFPADDPSIWTHIDAIFPYLSANGLVGPMNFQGRLNAGGLHLFEMNARFTGITGLRAIMGFNEVEASIANFLEIKSINFPSLAINPRRIGLRQISDRVIDIYRDKSLEQSVFRTGLFPWKEKKKTVLVTGAIGYLGRNLIPLLIQEPWVASVVALTRDISAAKKVLSEVLHQAGKQLQIIEWQDLRNGRINLGMIDLVTHLAFSRQMDDFEAIAESLRKTEELSVLVSQYHVPAIMYISSQSIYGLSRPPLWVEDLPAAPETPYATAKCAAELIIQSCNQLNPVIKTTSIRMARLYGAAPGMRWAELPHLFIRQAMEEKPIIIQGGQQQLDLLHVNDAVNGILCLLRKPEQEWKPIYNLGSGNSVNICDLAKFAVEAAVQKVQNPSKIHVQKGSSQLKLGMDISRIVHDTGWKPQKTIRTAMNELADLISLEKLAP